jgi:hypothetical protein
MTAAQVQPVVEIPSSVPAVQPIRKRAEKRISALIRQREDFRRRVLFLEGENEELEKLLAKSQDLIDRYRLELSKAKEKLRHA